MKAIFNLIKTDFFKIIRNWAAIIVLLVLCILPSLYAWFNIKACWDPYDPNATHNIKVAVINNDDGYDFNGQKINMGKKVIEELKKNNALGWEFISKEEANKELENEQIYASIEFPANFSSSILSIVTDNITPAEIDYTVNDKMNAIAPKITIKGAEQIQQNINTTIVGTISNIIFSTLSNLGINLEQSLPTIEILFNKVKSTESKFSQINTLVNSSSVEIEAVKQLLIEVQQDLPNLESTFQTAKNFTKSLETFVSTSQAEIEKISPAIVQDFDLIISISNNIEENLQNIITAIKNNDANVVTLINNLLVKINTIDNSITSLEKFLESLNNILPNSNLQNIIDKLNKLLEHHKDIKTNLEKIKEAINNGQRPDIEILNKLKQLANNVKTQTTTIKNDFNNTIKPELNDLLSKAYNTANKALTTISSAENKIPEVKNIINNAINIANNGGDFVQYLKQNLPTVENAISNLVAKVEASNDKATINDLLNLITKNAEQRAQFLANPVTLKETTLFSMGNYGTAMTPFYTVLCLWVGATLLVSILKVNVSKKYSAWQNYFARLPLFVGIGIIQALIVSLGDLYLLHIQCVNPLLFVISMVFTAICFNTIVYSLVSLMGNAGKVIAIVLLVLQVAASGGTYPVQLMDSFFQNINPFLPFTYAISFGREAIGGVVNTILIKDISFLLIYAGITMILCLILKKNINKISNLFDDKFNESGISEEVNDD